MADKIYTDSNNNTKIYKTPSKSSFHSRSANFSIFEKFDSRKIRKIRESSQNRVSARLALAHQFLDAPEMDALEVLFPLFFHFLFGYL
jgi:hypothetical protein